VQVARINLVLGLTNTVPAFLLSGFYASVADRYGRKFCMVLPTLGYSTYVAMLLVQAWRRSTGRPVSLAMLETCTAVGLGSLGLSGSFSTFQMALFSYAADFTALEAAAPADSAAPVAAPAAGAAASTRAASTAARAPPATAATGDATRGVVYSFIEASLFFGKTAGPLFSGLYAQGHGFVGPLLVSAAMCVVLLLFLLFAMPDSPGPGGGRWAQPDYKAPLVLEPLRTVKNIRLLFRDWERQLPWVAAAFLLFFVAYQGSNELNILYLKHGMGWGPALVGGYEAAESLMQAVGMTAVPWLIVYFVGEYVDITWLLVAYACRTAHFALFAVAETDALYFGILPLLLLAACITPRSRTFVSNSVPPTMQAAAMSGFSALQSCASFLTPLISLAYSYTVYYYAGTIYLCFAALCLGGGSLVLWAKWGMWDPHAGVKAEAEAEVGAEADAEGSITSPLLL